MNQDEPVYDIAHLAHLELLTPKPEESLRFFVEVMGMTESGRKGDSVYLRGWDDYEHYSATDRLQIGVGTSGFGPPAQPSSGGLPPWKIRPGLG
jgi:catechol 2,3-dioxygenase